LVAAIQKPKPATDVGPKLDALRDAVAKLGQVMNQPSAPQIDLTPVLEKLSVAMAQRPAPVAVAAPPQVDLGPVLEKLTEAVSQRQAPVAPPQVDLGPVLQQLAQNARLQAQTSENEGTFREEMAQQLLLIQERLSELALSARTVLQNDSEGSVKAMTVWNQTKEALELLKALPSRGRKPKPRG
jgi:hypothetical protein